MAKLLSSLPVGTKIKFGKHSVNGEAAQPIIWVIVAKNHTGYPSNSVTLLTEQAIDLRAYDAREPNSSDPDIVSYGNNTYSLSNIDQWLNSDKTSWYTPTHSTDQAPTYDHIHSNTQYDARPGFLTNFTSSERLAILTTSIIATKYYRTTETLSRRVFLPSAAEVGEVLSVIDGTAWGYFSGVSSRISTMTDQCRNNTLCYDKPETAPYKSSWLLRSAHISTSSGVLNIDTSGNLNYPSACYGHNGIRPVVNLNGAQGVSDTTDSDGCYVVVYNSAPSAPNSITVPTNVYGGKSNTISWSQATDPDGNTVTYQLECAVNGGSYTQIYSGASLSYAHLVPFGTSTITYRVKATDTSAASSAYTTSATRTVINNNAPVISGADANLGIKSSGFTGTYTITDANNNTVTVTEAIDGVQIRAFVATLGATNTYGITETTWLTLANGTHTLTIRATDGIDTSVRTYTFTKLVEGFTIQNSAPWSTSVMPTRIMLLITRNIPTTATFKVEVCNNGYDSSPTWEDCTDAVKSGLIHVFNNTQKTATNWGVRIRVTVNRNGATGMCYISAIGGNFE